MAADIVLGNICPGHVPSCTHLRARVIARAYKQDGQGMTNCQEGLMCRLIPVFPRLIKEEYKKLRKTKKKEEEKKTNKKRCM